MLPHDALVVVADGQSALLFRNTARHGVYLAEVGRITSASCDRPGNDNGQGRIAADDPDGFARQLADHLNAMACGNGFDDIAILAAPAFLGILRRHYHKELQFRLRREIDRNLVNADVRDISAILI